MPPTAASALNAVVSLGCLRLLARSRGVGLIIMLTDGAAWLAVAIRRVLGHSAMLTDRKFGRLLDCQVTNGVINHPK